MSNNTPSTGISTLLNVVSVDHKEIAKAIKFELTEGNVNPIEALLAFKKMQKIIESTIDGSKGDKELKDLFHKSVANALDGGKSVDMYGADLRIQDTGVHYDFTECGDEYLNELYRIQDIVKESIKQREEEIKAIVPVNSSKLGINSRTIVNEQMPHFEWLDHGQDSTIVPPIRKAGSSIIVTFKK